MDSKKRGNDIEYDADNKYLKTEDGQKSSTKKQSGPRFTEYARLNAPRSQILMEIEKEREVRGRSSLGLTQKRGTRTYIVDFIKIWDIRPLTVCS